MRKIILASSSLRRKKFLKKNGLKFIIFPSRIKESIRRSPSIERHVIALALSKAENVAKKFSNGLVIAADTVVVYKNKIFGKPVDFKHAKRTLSTLSGTKHYVYTAIAVLDIKSRNKIADIDKTTIYARKLSPGAIEELAKKNHDKAGAYAVQENSDLLVEKIEGNFDNVVGLPLEKLKKALENFGLNFKHSK